MATDKPRRDEEETRINEPAPREQYQAESRREHYGEPPPGYGYGPGHGYGPPPGPWGPWGGPWGPGRGFGMRQSYPIETKPFFLTSEFVAVIIAIVALAITAGTDDSIDGWRFWILTTVLVAFYVLSRGIAKSGTKSQAPDPREDLLRGLGRGDESRDRD